MLYLHRYLANNAINRRLSILIVLNSVNFVRCLMHEDIFISFMQWYLYESSMLLF